MKAFDDDLAKIDHISKKSVYLFQADETFLNIRMENRNKFTKHNQHLIIENYLTILLQG